MYLNRYYLLIICFVLSTSISNFVSIIIFKYTNHPIAFSLPAINDILLLALFFATCIKAKIKIVDLTSFILIFSIFVLLILNFFTLNSADTAAKIFSIRRIITLLLSVIVGINIYQSTDFLDNYFRFHKLVFFGVAIFGLLEYTLHIEFWDKIIEVPKYWQAKGDLFAGNKDTVESSGKFFSYDLYILLNEKNRRMVSFYVEAKPLASYCIFLAPYFLMRSEYRTSWLIKALTIISGILTFSKGFLLVLLMIWAQKYIRLKPQYMLVVLLLFIAFGAFVFYNNLGFGPLSHIKGLYTGVMVLANGNLTGVGLGASGNYTSEFVESIGGGESGFGAMIAQVGIVAVLFIFLIYKLANKLYNYYLISNNRIYYIGFVSIFAWYINFLYAEAAMGFRGNIFVFLTVGLLLGSIKKKNGN